jgi:hypothetical protein
MNYFGEELLEKNESSFENQNIKLNCKNSIWESNTNCPVANPILDAEDIQEK